jgi:hypothetical protein
VLLAPVSLDASRRALQLQPALQGWHKSRALDAAIGFAALPLLGAGRQVVSTWSRVQRRVLVLTVVRDQHEATWRVAERELSSCRHDVAVAVSQVDKAGKFTNLNRLLSAREPAEWDWLLIIDDDVVLPRRFLDVFLMVAERFRFRIAQPAHCMVSHASWPITRRRPFSIARATNFVEIGPLTALHRDTIATLTPFPTDGMGWGLDFEWAKIAEERKWSLGVVDVTPIVHLVPAATAYSADDAAAAMARDVHEAPQTLATFRRWTVKGGSEPRKSPSRRGT